MLLTDTEYSGYNGYEVADTICKCSFIENPKRYKTICMCQINTEKYGNVIVYTDFIQEAEVLNNKEFCAQVKEVTLSLCSACATKKISFFQKTLK